MSAAISSPARFARALKASAALPLIFAATSFVSSAALAAEATVEFTSTPAPSTPAEMVKTITASKAIVTGKDGKKTEYALSYTVLFQTPDKVGSEFAAGQLFDAKGQPIKDPNGDFVVAETPDANSLLVVGGKPFLVTHHEYDWLLADGQDVEKAKGWHERMPMSMTLTALEQAKDGKLTAKSVKPIDFSSVDGLWIPCAGGPTPWGTHLGSEEDYDLYFQAVDGKKLHDRATNGLKALTEVYFRGEKQANPYAYGHIPEVTVNADGSTKVVKHYSMGRATWELARIAPDERTAYFGDDGDHVAFFMYVADKARDLSAGTLYVAKFKQTSDKDGGAGDLSWIKVGHATDAEVKAMIDKGLTFDDIFEATTSEATPDWEAKGFKRVRVGHSGDEYLKLKPGMERAAAFLESRRAAAMLGATTEFNKMEGVTYDPLKKNLYLAISYLEKGMLKEDGAPQDDIRLPKISAGATFEIALSGGQKDSSGAAIASDWVGTKMSVPAALLGEDIKADALGNTANPDKIANTDNVFFSPAMRTLFVGEDSGLHANNFLWAYNVDTKKLSRLLSLPSGAESTGLSVVDDLNGHAYITSNNQHQGEWIKSLPAELKGKLIEAATSAYGKNAKGVPNYYFEAKVGYLGGMPGM